MNEPADWFDTPDGARIAYADTGGGGPAVMLVHGHPFDMSMWDPQLDALTSRGWRVVRLDLRGYGQSSVTAGVTTLTRFAADVASLADRLELQTVTLMGLSMGGQIVMEFHRLFPARVAGMILADTSADAESPAGKIARNEQADRLMREGMYPYARDVLTRMVAPENVESHSHVAGHVMRMMLTTPPVGAAAALRGRAQRPDYLPSLATSVVPVLVVAGTEDTFTPVADAERIRAAVPGADLILIDGTAHLPNLEAPTEFNEAVVRFLTRIARPR